MGKPGGLGLFMGRRKSSLNGVDAADLNLAPEPAPAAESGGFRVMSQTEVQRAKQEKQESQRKAQEKASSKFGRFSAFGGGGNKNRAQSFEEDSPSSSTSKRDSKSSSGTQFSTSRPYHQGPYGSTSTLPSSADTDPNESMFSNLPSRPPIAQHGSSPSSFSMNGMRKQLPSLPQQTNSGSIPHPYDEPTSPNQSNGRTRALTTSSYASTAIPPKLDADLNFGGGFDDMFSGLERKSSPDFTKEPAGRSLLSGKRTFQAEPINIDRKLEVEPPLQSWDSRGSDDNLMSPQSDKNYSPPPPPVPTHKYASKYAPIASDSPDLHEEDFEDQDIRTNRQPYIAQAKDSPSQNRSTLSTPSTKSLQPALSSKSTLNDNASKADSHYASSFVGGDDAEEDLFASSQPKAETGSKPAPKSVASEKPSTVPTRPGEIRRMTEAEFRAQQAKQSSHPADDSSEDEDDYEDEDEIIEKRQKEEQARRVKQQQQLARIHMQRATTAPTDPHQRTQSMGFPSEVSLQADEWSDEDIPLGVLAAHGFPSSTRQPTQPPNAAPSYFRTTPSALPDRPSSAGPMGARASTYRPPFARNLPDDPYSSVIGGGLVKPMNRESMGFNRSAGSVYGEPMLPYHEPNTQPSLVERIHMSEMAKPKYMGGASSKNAPQGGPFTGALGSQMNGMGQSPNPTRMSTQGIPGMNGSPMMGMMGQPMPMMGMNPMGYPQSQNDMMQFQQQMFMAQQQMQMQQMQQMQMYGQPDFRMSMIQPQDPRMSMLMPMNSLQAPNFGNGAFMNSPGALPNQQRPVSMFQQQVRPFSTHSQFGPPPQGGFAMGGLAPPANGYTPSIAPSERSNIGLSARYRPVATGNQDTSSNVSSMTLQASGGAAQTNSTVKGILKNKSPQITVHEDDEDDWSKMNARKSKFAAKGKSENGNGLQDLAHVVDGY